MFDIPPKCPALADKITGLFGWRQTYRVHHKQKGIPHTSYLHKSYSLTLAKKTDSSTSVTVGHIFSCYFCFVWITIHSNTQQTNQPIENKNKKQNNRNVKKKIEWVTMHRKKTGYPIIESHGVVWHTKNKYKCKIALGLSLPYRICPFVLAWRMFWCNHGIVIR